MITIYKNKKDIPQDMEYIELNDVYFNQKTASILDERAEKIIEEIDGSMRVGKYKIRSRFDDIIIDIDKLSAGCKTALNVLYNPDKIFCLKECGNNALEVVYSLEQGNVYLDYQRDIGEMIRSSRGKLIVIDNADVLLDDSIRKYIALDDKNQYLIIGRNPKNLFTTKENLYELISHKKGDQTVLELQNYL